MREMLSLRRSRVPVRLQSTATECGAACLAMVVSFYGRDTEIKELREDLGIGRDGSSLLALVQAVRRIGMEARAFRAPVEKLAEFQLPLVVHWERSHYVVVERIREDAIEIIDPAFGRRTLSHEEFAESYGGVVLAARPGPDFVLRPRERLHFFKFVGRFVPRSPRHVATILLSSLGLVGLALIPPQVTRLVVDHAIPSGDGQVVVYLALGTVAFVLGHSMMTLFRGELLLWLQFHIDQRMMTSFLRHLLSLPYQYFQLRHGGDLLVRVSSTAYVRDVVSGQLLALVIDTGLIVVYLAVIGVQSLTFVVVLLVLASIQVAVLGATAKRAQRLAERELITLGESQSRLLETVNGIESVKSAGAEDSAYERWAERYFEQVQASVNRRRLDNGIEAVLSAVRVGTPIVSILVGTLLVITQQLTIGQMLALVALAGAALAPLAQLGRNLQALQTVRVHLNRLRDAFDERSESEGQGGQEIDLQGSVSLRGVGFAYGKGSVPALQDINLDIDAKQRVAIVGRSGSGKSTLARLLVGLLTPVEGEIAFDSVPLRDLDLSSVRSQCGVVTQSADVLSGSIFTNISLAAPEASREDVAEAAALADLANDIDRMPLKYDTVLGESGIGLSGGQLQRLALARALVRRPRILVLDEATSHLDATTEVRVFENLAELECTQVIIAHRLSTIRDADAIVVLEDGQVAAKGTHEELLENSPLYAELVSHQLTGPQGHKI